MLVSDIRLRNVNGQAELCATVSSAALERPFDLWYRVPETFSSYLSNSGEAFVTFLWPIACALGEDLTVEAPVSPVLKAALPGITEVLAC